MSYLNPVRKPPPGIEITTMKDYYIYPVNELEQGMHTHTHAHTLMRSETKHPDAIFGARKLEFTMLKTQTAAGPRDQQEQRGKISVS